VEEAVAQLKALVIDDSQAMRRSIVYALHRIEGMACSQAEDGAEGLQKLASERFDVIITDINMPIMDGLKLIAYVRSEESTHKSTPVVVITTESAPEDRRRALGLGANAYLVKPLRAQTVIATIRDLLKIGPSVG
jgi:two-component system chemotaxis response regulator CheY